MKNEPKSKYLKNNFDKLAAALKANIRRRKQSKQDPAPNKTPEEASEDSKSN